MTAAVADTTKYQPELGHHGIVGPAAPQSEVRVTQRPEVKQQQERRRKANRRLVLRVQAMAAFFTAMVYLNPVALDHFPWG
jgi:hypothetical protein